MNTAQAQPVLTGTMTLVSGTFTVFDTPVPVAYLRARRQKQQVSDRPARSRRKLNAYLSDNYAEIIAKAERNTKRLTGKNRF